VDQEIDLVLRVEEVVKYPDKIFANLDEGLLELFERRAVDLLDGLPELRLGVDQILLLRGQEVEPLLFGIVLLKPRLL
jgi:hypothetical protein